MSGRKRALLRMNERDRLKLLKIESRLGEVDQDFSTLQSKITELKKQASTQIGEQQQSRDIVLENSILHLDWRIKEIEEATQIALENQIINLDEAERQTQSWQIDNKAQIENHKSLILDLLGQYNNDLEIRMSSFEDDFQSGQIQLHKQRELSWQTLNYAQEIMSNLRCNYPDHMRWEPDLSRIDNLLSIGWANYQNGLFQAAIVQAQGAISSLVEIRFYIQDYLNQLASKRSAAIELSTQILNLASHCSVVNAINLEGNELDVLINVNSWSDGLINKSIQILQSIQFELINSESGLDLESLDELITQTLPEWDKVLHECVSKARKEAIASQIRYEVARTVVDALAEQGYELVNGSYDSNDMRSPYYVILGNITGSKVQICVSALEENSLTYLLDIDSYDSELRSEHELRQRARELLGSVAATGINVDQVYQAYDPGTKVIKETSSNSYSIKSKSVKRMTNNKSQIE
jgi:hypothetical protein